MRRLTGLVLMLLAPAAGLCAGPGAGTGSHPPARAGAGFELDALLERLARPAPSSTPFVEAHFSALLSRPLVVSGRLEYLGSDALARTVNEPYHERAEIRGDTVTLERENEPARHFSLDRAPAMRSLLASFTALLGGKVAALERQFRLDLHGDAARWTVGLTPRDPEIHRQIRAITVSGSGFDLRCLTTFQANGDVTVTLVSRAARAARARMPRTPSRAWFDAECRGSGAHAGDP
jgi:Outer membrane lipoprotein carrier protein LolA-like